LKGKIPWLASSGTAATVQDQVYFEVIVEIVTHHYHHYLVPKAKFNDLSCTSSESRSRDRRDERHPMRCASPGPLYSFTIALPQRQEVAELTNRLVTWSAGNGRFALHTEPVIASCSCVHRRANIYHGRISIRLLPNLDNRII
jgi:hypothetical protein